MLLTELAGALVECELARKPTYTINSPHFQLLSAICYLLSATEYGDYLPCQIIPILRNERAPSVDHLIDKNDAGNCGFPAPKEVVVLLLCESKKILKPLHLNPKPQGVSSFAAKQCSTFEIVQASEKAKSTL